MSSWLSCVPPLGQGASRDHPAGEPEHQGGGGAPEARECRCICVPPTHENDLTRRRVHVPPSDPRLELLRALQPQPQRPSHQSLQDGGRWARRRGQPRGLQNIGAHAGGEGGVDQIHQVRPRPPKFKSSGSGGDCCPFSGVW